MITTALLAVLTTAVSAASEQRPQQPFPDAIRAFYDALSAGTDVSDLLSRATSAEWASCGGNDLCNRRDHVIRTVSAVHDAVPDMKWEIKEVLTTADRIIVRGEATGTPVVSFMGVPPGGKRFKLMSIDVHTLEGGKIIRSYHVEDWMGAVRQLSAK